MNQYTDEHPTQFADCLQPGMDVPPTCLLCLTKPPQRCSHVLPRAVSRGIGKVLGSYKLRSSANVNESVQDTAKFPLFCHGCEEQMGAFERRFVIDHFEPYFRDEVRSSYKTDLHKLLVVVAFRTLCYISVGPERKRLTKPMRETIEMWRKYLYEDNVFTGHDIYLVRHHELTRLRPGWAPANQFNMSQGVRASHPSASLARYFVYGQMGPFHLFADLGTISGRPDPVVPTWLPFAIAPQGGAFGTPSALPAEMDYVLAEEAHDFANKLDRISDAQRKVVESTQNKAHERLVRLKLR